MQDQMCRHPLFLLYLHTKILAFYYHQKLSLYSQIFEILKSDFTINYLELISRWRQVQFHHYKYRNYGNHSACACQKKCYLQIKIHDKSTTKAETNEKQTIILIKRTPTKKDLWQETPTPTNINLLYLCLTDKRQRTQIK